VNESEKTTGRMHLFKDEASLEAYLKVEIVAGLKSAPSEQKYKTYFLKLQRFAASP